MRRLRSSISSGTLLPVNGGPIIPSHLSNYLFCLAGKSMRHPKSSLVRVAGVLLAATSLSGTALVAQTATAPAVAATPHFGTWGVDLNNRDLSVKPGDDFQKYTSGQWLARTEIPADKPEVGSFYELFDLSQDQLKNLVTKAPAGSKYGALYASFMDEGRVDQLGLAPLKPDLARVAALGSKTAMARHMGVTSGDFGASFFSFHLEPDTADASMNAVYVNQSGLGMPNRDYYLTPAFKPQRDAYRAYMERTFKAIGNPNPAAATARVMALETAIAQKSWASADGRDIE